MEQEFWHDRWSNNEIGFHQDDINPYLKRYWPQLNLNPGAQVWVPCCGKSLDLLWLKEQGFDVKGIEISPLAVAAFFKENDLKADDVVKGDFRISSIEGLQLYCGDFFKLSSTVINGIDAIYDRASMIAMPVEMRRKYCQHLQNITDRKVPILLVTLEYPANEMEGPPFSVNEDEVREHYAVGYHITVLETNEIIADNPYFQERGLSRLQERSYLLTPDS